MKLAQAGIKQFSVAPLDVMQVANVFRVVCSLAEGMVQRLPCLHSLSEASPSPSNGSDQGLFPPRPYYIVTIARQQRRNNFPTALVSGLCTILASRIELIVRRLLASRFPSYEVRSGLVMIATRRL